jgi:hypothetical protein
MSDYGDAVTNNKLRDSFLRLGGDDHKCENSTTSKDSQNA